MIVLPATLMVRVPAGALSEPRLPTAAMRLSVTSTSPCGITSSPFIVMMRAPVSSTEPFGRDARQLDDDVGLLRLGGVDRPAGRTARPTPRSRPCRRRSTAGSRRLRATSRLTGTAALSPRPWMRTSTVSRPAIGTVTR